MLIYSVVDTALVLCSNFWKKRKLARNVTIFCYRWLTMCQEQKTKKFTSPLMKNR